jgi:hypothetical protein
MIYKLNIFHVFKKKIHTSSLQKETFVDIKQIAPASTKLVLVPKSEHM